MRHPHQPEEERRHEPDALGRAKLTIREMMRDLTPMIGVLIVALAITTYWPALVMWIPNLLK
jgi:TRAP-type C4-dicarboxylate transport system permease large subunit